MNEGKEITMLYDEIINIVTLAGEMILQAHEEELTIYDKAGISNFVTKHDKDVQSYLIRNLRIILPEANSWRKKMEFNKNWVKDIVLLLIRIDGTTNFIFDYSIAVFR